MCHFQDPHQCFEFVSTDALRQLARGFIEVPVDTLPAGDVLSRVRKLVEEAKEQLPALTGIMAS
jgi:hypothetical protein